MGSYKYDPGKYYNNSSDPSTNTTTTTKSDGGDGDDDGTSKQLDPYQEQLEAPWNQYAWAEELRLRVSYMGNNGCIPDCPTGPVTHIFDRSLSKQRFKDKLVLLHHSNLPAFGIGGAVPTGRHIIHYNIFGNGPSLPLHGVIQMGLMVIREAVPLKNRMPS